MYSNAEKEDSKIKQLRIVSFRLAPSPKNLKICAVSTLIIHLAIVDPRMALQTVEDAGRYVQVVNRRKMDLEIIGGD